MESFSTVSTIANGNIFNVKMRESILDENNTFLIMIISFVNLNNEICF